MRRNVLVPAARVIGLLVAFAVQVTSPLDRYRHQVQIAVAHAATGDELIGKAANSTQRPAQDAGFQAVVVVKVHVQRGHREVVMIVLCVGQLTSKVPLVMIENIGQNAHAIAIGVFFGPLTGQESAQQVAYGFRAAAVTQPLPIALERLGKFLIE